MSNFIAEYVKKGNNNYMIIKADREYMTRKINTCMTTVIQGQARRYISLF